MEWSWYIIQCDSIPYCVWKTHLYQAWICSFHTDARIITYLYFSKSDEIWLRVPSYLAERKNHVRDCWFIPLPLHPHTHLPLDLPTKPGLMWYQEVEEVPISRSWSSASVATVPHRTSWYWQGLQFWRWKEGGSLIALDLSQDWLQEVSGPDLKAVMFSVLSPGTHHQRFCHSRVLMGGVQISDPFNLQSLLSTSFGHISSLLGLLYPLYLSSSCSLSFPWSTFLS